MIVEAYRLLSAYVSVILPLTKIRVDLLTAPQKGIEDAPPLWESHLHNYWAKDKIHTFFDVVFFENR